MCIFSDVKCCLSHDMPYKSWCDEFKSHSYFTFHINVFEEMCDVASYRVLNKKACFSCCTEMKHLYMKSMPLLQCSEVQVVKMWHRVVSWVLMRLIARRVAPSPQGF